MKMIFLCFFLMPLSITCETIIFESMLICLLFLTSSLFFNWEYIHVFNMDFFLDKTSSILVFLSAWVIILMLLTISPYTKKSFLSFIIMSLLITLILLFQVLKILPFFVCFEFSLIPTMGLILGWGYQPERIEASFYFFFYTMIFSLPFLGVMIYFSSNYWNSFLFKELFWQTSTLSQFFLNHFYFFIFMVFMVKLPIYFFHFWLPKAHVEAPVPGSMILAGVLLKMGGYGIIRFMTLSPTTTVMKNLFISTSLVGMVLICLTCLTNPDLKAVIAYSSVSHMNFMILGLTLLLNSPISGGLILMISHGLISSCLFFLSDLIYKVTHSRSLFLNKGLILTSPFFSLFWFTCCLLNMAFPPSLGSISELMIGLALIKFYLLTQIFLILYFFLSAFYSIFIYLSTNHGDTHQSDLNSSPLMNSKTIFIFNLHLIPQLLLLLLLDIFIF
nr:NADH dehydrogenase subunit 4 [Actornithophilus hoplopteri]